MGGRGIGAYQKQVETIIDRIGRTPSMLVPILQAAQEEFKYLPIEVLELISSGLNVPPAKVYGVATFYAHFALEPKGEHIVRVCNGTACHVKGSHALMEEIASVLELEKGVTTTPDMMFSFETVSCLGACGLAPVIVMDEEVVGQATPKVVKREIKRVRREHKKAAKQAQEG